MGPYARVATVGQARGLRVVEEAREQAGEEEGAEWEVEDENVVNEAIIFEPEELRCSGDCYSETHAVAEPHYDGPHVE